MDDLPRGAVAQQTIDQRGVHRVAGTQLSKLKSGQLKSGQLDLLQISLTAS
jgi:hypothetical protein